MSSAVRTCPRCGIRRQVHENRTGELCRDCWLATRHTGRPPVMRGPHATRLNELLAMRARIDADIANLEMTMVRAGLGRTLCGTESGYTTHRRKDEPTCEACRKAHREGNRRRARRAQQRSPQAPVDADLGRLVVAPGPLNMSEREAS